MKPVLLDLFSGAGGAAMGYCQAGFDVVGVDINPQPHYPFRFIRADVTTLGLPELIKFVGAVAAHASPPCQAYSHANQIRRNEHPDLIEPVRDVLVQSGLPWVIENVEGSPLRDPVMLCGAMFPQLRVYRHRLFESSVTIDQPEHPEHVVPQAKMGRPPKPHEFMHVVGNFSNVQQARDSMGIQWMIRDEMSEAIPPAYTKFIGAQLARAVQERSAA